MTIQGNVSRSELEKWIQISWDPEIQRLITSFNSNSNKTGLKEQDVITASFADFLRQVRIPVDIIEAALHEIHRGILDTDDTPYPLFNEGLIPAGSQLPMAEDAEPTDPPEEPSDDPEATHWNGHAWVRPEAVGVTSEPPLESGEGQEPPPPPPAE